MGWTASPDRQALVLFKNELKLQIIWTGVDLSSNPLHSSPKRPLWRPGAERFHADPAIGKGWC